MTDSRATLLARGGRALGLASIAHAKGQRPNEPWNVLSKEIGAAADQILKVLYQGVDPSDISAAVATCMLPSPSSTPPLWVLPLLKKPALIPEVGSRLKTIWPPRDKGAPLADDKERGLAALALALCRNADSVRAIALELGEPDGEKLVRMAALAQTCAAPGAPSKERARLKRVIGEIDNG